MSSVERSTIIKVGQLLGTGGDEELDFSCDCMIIMHLHLEGFSFRWLSKTHELSMLILSCSMAWSSILSMGMYRACHLHTLLACSMWGSTNHLLYGETITINFINQTTYIGGQSFKFVVYFYTNRPYIQFSQFTCSKLHTGLHSTILSIFVKLLSI